MNELRSAAAERHLEEAQIERSYRRDSLQQLDRLEAELHHELGVAREAGDEELALRVSDQIADLPRLRQEASAALGAAEARAEHAAVSAATARERLHESQRVLDAALASFTLVDHSNTSVRELVSAALRELEAPASSSDLTDFIKVRYGRELGTSRFGPLRRDEERAYVAAVRSGRERPVWLVPGLHADGTADRRYLTRSDWDLGRRWTGNGPEARAFYHLLSLAMEMPRDTADPLGLLELALDDPDEFINQWEDSLGGRQAVLLNEIAPMEGPGDFARNAVLPANPRTPTSLLRWADDASPHELLFGADHDLELDDAVSV